MNARVGLLTILTLLTMACSSTSQARSLAKLDVSRPSAEIAEDFARFVFPNQKDSVLAKPMPGDASHYYWEVRWAPLKVGIDPQQLAVIARWPDERPPGGPLSAIVDAASTEVLTVCRECFSVPALAEIRDRVFDPPAITARMYRGSVVATVLGRAAIARLFPQRPDSVWLTIGPPRGHDYHRALGVKR